MSEFLKDAPRHNTIEELQLTMAKLFEFDSANLDTMALGQTRLFHEVQRLYLQESKYLRYIMRKYDKVFLHRKKYYMGVLPQSVYKAEPLNPLPLKSEIDMYMRADDIVCEMKELMSESEERVKYTEDCLKRVRDRGYDIKNAIEWRKVVESGLG